MTSKGLYSVLAVTILGLSVACDSSYSVPLEAARSQSPGAAAGQQKGTPDEEQIIEHVNPGLDTPVLPIVVTTPGVDGGSDEPSDTGDGADDDTDVGDTAALNEKKAIHEVDDMEKWESLQLPEKLAALISRARLECNVDQELLPYCLSTAFVVSYVQKDNELVPTECTAQYVGDNTVVTAAHCLSKDVLEQDAGCTDRVAFGFFQDGQSTLLPATCVAVKEHFRFLKAPNEGVEEEDREQDLRRSDVVFLEIAFGEGEGEVVKDNALTLSRSGFSPDDKFSFIGMTPFADKKLGGQIEIKTCEAIENTVLVDNHRDYRSEVVVLMGESCKAPPGNSGAAVVSHKTGEVVGIVHGYMDEAAKKYKDKQYRILEEEGVLNPVVATNFACLESNVVEERAELSGCNNLAQVIEQKRRSSWDEINREYREALDLSQKKAQSLFDLEILEVRTLLQVTAAAQGSMTLVRPLRVQSAILEPNFECHRATSGAEFAFDSVRREASQYLDKYLRVKSKQEVVPLTKNYELKSSGNFVRLTETESGHATDIPRCR